MIKKTLTGLVLGTALLGISKADIIDVPTNTNNLQEYVDIAQPGDTLNIVYSNGFPGIFSSAVINKDLKIEGNGLTIAYENALRIIDNSNVNINNLRSYAYLGTPIIVENQSSLDYRNGVIAGLTGVVFNSFGNLNLENNYIDTFNMPNEKKVYIENLYGNVSITKNTFVAGETAVYIAHDFGSNLNILNNTIDSMQESAIHLDVPLQAEGYIANNSISNCGWDINNLNNLGNLVFTNNNIWNTQDPPTENFYLNPMYIDESNDNFHLYRDSPLWNKGLYLDGQTTWFPNENSTWIGAYGDVPEPTALELIITGSLLGLYRRRK